jgi:hypothetical protein
MADEIAPAELRILTELERGYWTNTDARANIS